MKYTAIFIVLLVFLLLGCKNQSTTHSLRPAKGGKKYGSTYRINMIRGNPNGLDPVIITSKLADDIALQIYDRLITFDSLLNIKPELAKSWDISQDGLRYTFHLRTDVYFHDNICFPNGLGRRMTSQDVCYSFNRCCDPRTRTAAMWVFKDKVVGANEYYHNYGSPNPDTSFKSVKGIIPLNDSTVQITLTRAYAPFIMQLANALGCIVPKEAVVFYGQDFFKNPVGTGAYIFDSWKEDYQIVLRRNTKYWQYDNQLNRLPFLDTIIVSFVKDDKIQFQDFKSGNLDESFNIPTELFPAILDIETRTPKSNVDFVVQQKPAMLSWFIDMLCTKPPFNNADVRRAFSYAIDKEKISKYVLRNSPYQPAHNGITPPVMPGYDISSITGFEYNPALAQQYLSQAGYPKGKDFPQVTLSIYPEPRLIQVAEAVQQMLAENLNININIKVIQFAQLLDLAEAGKLQFWCTRWYGDYPDVENYLSLLDGSLVPVLDNQPSYPNSTRYNNPEFNTLLSKSVAITDIQTRNEMYKQAELIVTKDAPCIMLFYDMHYRLLQPYVRDYPLDAMNRIQIKHAWFAW
ncbi:MAG: ABC transporter substrate-binding protein [Bacteriodetes bacterium]|nr:ABC transporter substrate-binding protein [Bacteroidota bacterium]